MNEEQERPSFVMKLLVAHGKIPRPSCLSRHSEPEFEKIVLQLHTLNWVGAKEREVYFLYLEGGIYSSLRRLFNKGENATFEVFFRNSRGDQRL